MTAADRSDPAAARCGLPLSRADIWEAIAPYVSERTGLGDPAWTSRVSGQVRALRREWLKGLARRLLRGGARSQADVDAAYDARWSADRYRPYVLPEAPKGGQYWEWDGEVVRMKASAGRRARVRALMAAVEMLRPRSVLEVGFGEGLNLMLLAARFPGTRFAGLEFTAGGCAAAAALARSGRLPQELAAFAPLPPADPAAVAGVSVVRGSAERLPFPDGAFDMVFTSLALEQMEAIRPAAMAEIVRASARHVVMIEPFAEHNAGGARGLYVRTSGYFRGRLADLPGLGLDLLEVRTDLPAKVVLKPVLAVCAKRGAA